jgi:cardiolipin synthase
MTPGFRFSATLLAASVLTGCAMLPGIGDLEREAAARPDATLRVLGPDGLLMGEHRQMIEERLKGMSATGLLARQLMIAEVATGAALVVGNATEILIDGPQAYAAIFAAIEAARDHVHIESFIFEELDFGRRLSDLLIAKQREGVEVSVLYDSVGSFATPAEFLERLRAAGIRACEFNPVNPFVARMWRLNHRDHRKIVVVDGRIGFTGGINFHGVYRTGSMPFGSRRAMPTLDEGWRDTHLAIHGPAVRELQELFVRSWAKQGCPALPERELFPPLAAAGDRVVAVVGASPDRMMSRTYFSLLSAISYAERSVYLTAAYFAPDENTIRALTGAAARGVDVRLLLPGFTDSWLAFHAGRSHYERLLAGGVRIYERRDALLHAKTAVVDGVWSSIGSSNVDWRSFTHNDEVIAVVFGEAFGAEMNELFFRDLAAADEVREEAWRGRGAVDRLAEWLSRRLEYWL